MQYFAPAFLGSITCLVGSNDKIKQSIIYQVKCLRKALKKETNAKKEYKIIILDVLLKLLLPMSFIALKITGSYIDFMLALGLVKFAKTADSMICLNSIDLKRYMIPVKVNSENEGLKSNASSSMKNLLGEKMVQSFYFRTCVDATIENDGDNTQIRYSSLTADISATSDEGLDCVNIVEITYFCLMGIVLFLGFVSFLRLRKVFYQLE